VVHAPVGGPIAVGGNAHAARCARAARLPLLGIHKQLVQVPAGGVGASMGEQCISVGRGLGWAQAPNCLCLHLNLLKA